MTRIDIIRNDVTFMVRVDKHSSRNIIYLSHRPITRRERYTAVRSSTSYDNNDRTDGAWDSDRDFSFSLRRIPGNRKNSNPERRRRKKRYSCVWQKKTEKNRRLRAYEV